MTAAADGEDSLRLNLLIKTETLFHALNLRIRGDFGENGDGNVFFFTDYNTIKSLQRNKAFLAYHILDKTKDDVLCSCTISGYCLNRSFFHSKGFRGRLIDIDFRGKGLGAAMNRLLNEVGVALGLNLFETVSTDNIASSRSALGASRIKILHDNKETNELYIEIINKPMSDINNKKNRILGGGKPSIKAYYSGSFNKERAA